MDRFLCLRSPEMDKLANEVRETFVVLKGDMESLDPYGATVMRGDYSDSIWVSLFIIKNETGEDWTEEWCDEVAEEIIQAFEDWDFPEEYNIDFTRNYNLHEVMQVSFYIYEI